MEDLFYRINVLPIHLPALRERGADIVALAEFFLQKALPPKRLSEAAARDLLAWPWPGNVRELQNLMHSAALTVRGDIIDASDLRLEAAGSAGESLEDLLACGYHEAIARLEKLLLARSLAQANGNRAEAARLLGIHRQLLYAKLKEHGLGA